MTAEARRPEDAGQVRVGCGRLGAVEKPVLVMVDCQRLFTRGGEPGTALGAAVDACGHAVRSARAGGIAVVWLRTLYADPAELGPVWTVKAPALAELVPGGEPAEFDERAGFRAGDEVVPKQRASGFVGTGLDELLRRMGARTVAIAGFTTAGCVRATAVDAASLDYLPVVFADAVADRTGPIHDAALVDLDARYADVTDSRSWFAQLPR